MPKLEGACVRVALPYLSSHVFGIRVPLVAPVAISRVGAADVHLFGRFYKGAFVFLFAGFDLLQLLPENSARGAVVQCLFIILS